MTSCSLEKAALVSELATLSSSACLRCDHSRSSSCHDVRSASAATHVDAIRIRRLSCARSASETMLLICTKPKSSPSAATGRKQALPALSKTTSGACASEPPPPPPPPLNMSAKRAALASSVPLMASQTYSPSKNIIDTGLPGGTSLVTKSTSSCIR